MTTQSSIATPLAGHAGADAADGKGRPVAALYGLVLGGLLLGYMFLGRGFAHIGIGPIFIGDVVLLVGLGAAAFVLIRSRRWPAITWTIALVLAFAALGAVRTLPYLGIHGLDALRDGVLWGYAAFALIVYGIADRRFVLDAFRAYGWVVPIFALWLPISWNLFRFLSAEIDPNRPGDFVPLVFFKGGDMAIHTVGAIAFLVLGASRVASVRTFLWRTLVCIPLLWTVFVAGTSNRGALITAILGIVAIAVLAPRSRNWLPFLAAIGLGASALLLQGVLVAFDGSAPNSGSTDVLPGAGLVSAGPAATASTSLSPAEGNRISIANAGFEFGGLRTGTIDGWSPFGAGTYNLVAGRAYRGTNFALVDNTADAYQATLTSDTFSVRAGEDIVVRVWVKAVTGRPVLETYVKWFDRAGTLLSSDFAGAEATEGSTRWQEAVGVQTVPDTATDAAILFYEAKGAAAIGIDQVMVRSGDFVSDPPAEAGAAPTARRPATLEQMADNLLSLFVSSDDPGLEGTKQFRLAWWGTIVDYTVLGEHFWTGKGFGVNLADDDGFQSTADGSLRAPHNSHLTVLARMGVPGIVLWLLIQAAFGLGLWRATLTHRRAGNMLLASIGAWILVYWSAMMVNTSFDPYLEGPQGGIWFWALIGLGLACMRLNNRGPEGG